VAQRARAVPIKPNLGRNKGKIFGFTFWTGHNAPQAVLNAKETRLSEMPEIHTVAANRGTYNQNCQEDRLFSVNYLMFDFVISKTH
jgi:hypothetical protein